MFEALVYFLSYLVAGIALVLTGLVIAGFIIGFRNAMKKAAGSDDDELVANIEAAAKEVAELPILQFEEVPYKDSVVYLVNQMNPYKFIGQGNTITELNNVLKKKFSGKQFVVLSQDGMEGIVISADDLK